MKTELDHFSPEVRELARRGTVCAAIVESVRLDLARAEEILQDDPPSPKWWWRFSAYHRATAHNFLVAQEVLNSAPMMIELVSAEFVEIRKKLKREHRTNFCYTERDGNILRVWIEEMGGESFEIPPETGTVSSKFNEQ